MVESTREIGERIEQETPFYITSLVWLAYALGPVIRSHWSIENSLHCVMDMIFRDGECRHRSCTSQLQPNPQGAGEKTLCASNAKSPLGTMTSSQATSLHDFFTRFP
jgi:hypothetical protein